MSETANISIYDQARIKLTDIGVEILINYENKFSQFNFYDPKKIEQIKETKQYESTVGDIMYIFGRYFVLGEEIPFFRTRSNQTKFLRSK